MPNQHSFTSHKIGILLRINFNQQKNSRFLQYDCLCYARIGANLGLSVPHLSVELSHTLATDKKGVAFFRHSGLS